MFTFNFNKDLTKETLLKYNSEETYMEHYTGVPIQKGLFRSPLRVDPNPTCSFYKNKSGSLILHDFRGDFHGNFIAVVMLKFTCSYHRALTIIANDFGIIQKSNLKINPPKIEYTNTILEETKPSAIRVEIKDFTQKELTWWASFGISYNTLKKFYVYSCKNIFLNGVFFTAVSENNPSYGYYGGKRNGLEMWRIYTPSKRNFRFLSNWQKIMIQGAHMLPEKGELVVITKSLKDVMLLYELGIPAIAPTSESTFVSEKQLEKLKERFNRVVLLYDNDIAGIKAMNKYRKLFKIDCMWLPRNTSKDISDFYKANGKIKTLKLIEYGKSRLYN